MADLKKCPFCGGEAEIHSKCSYEETGGDIMFFVKCESCGAESGWHTVQPIVIEAWNNRITETSVHTGNDVVERIVERVKEKRLKGCTKKCPQMKLADECATGRMYATKELIKCQKELQAFKDKQEQGLLLELPCKVGDTVYEIQPLTGKITPRTIRSTVICNAPELTIMYKSGYDYSNVQEDFGKTVFLTRSKAEEALAKMKGE